MNFSNIKLATDKGTTRKSTAGTSRESNFSFRFAHYTKQTKSGEQEISQFAFTEGAMNKFGLNSAEKGAVPFIDEETGTVGIAVVPVENAVFLGTAKRGEDKARNVSVPVLVKYMEQVGLVDTQFNGSQYFDLEVAGEQDGVTYLKISASSIQPKVYNQREVKEEADSSDATHSSVE